MLNVLGHAEILSGVAAHFDDARLVSLIKALTVVDSPAAPWCRGSVSPVPPLFSELQRRLGGDGMAELTEWILQHRANEWLPFNTPIPLECRSLEQLRALRRRRAEQRQARLDSTAWARIESARAQLFHPSKEDVARDATEKLAGAIKRRDLTAVRTLLRKGADPQGAGPTGESLLALAESVGDVRIVDLLRGR